MIPIKPLLAEAAVAHADFHDYRRTSAGRHIRYLAAEVALAFGYRSLAEALYLRNGLTGDAVLGWRPLLEMRTKDVEGRASAESRLGESLGISFLLPKPLVDPLASVEKAQYWANFDNRRTTKLAYSSDDNRVVVVSSQPRGLSI